MRDALAIVEILLEAPAEFHLVDVVGVKEFGEGLGKAAVVLVEKGDVTEDECKRRIINRVEG